jgi:hypothetical protein
VCCFLLQANDPAQFLIRTQHVYISTETAGPVANFVFRSDCWNGGFEDPGALIDGRFRCASPGGGRQQ